MTPVAVINGPAPVSGEVESWGSVKRFIILAVIFGTAELRFDGAGEPVST